MRIPIFTLNDVVKLFPNEPTNQIITQLYRMIRRSDLLSLKRGVYMFPDTPIDEFVLANKLYGPSYVSLESALNIYGIFPDIAVNITSLTPITSKKIRTPKGTFLYSKINKELFFGFTQILDQSSETYYQIALPEKALLDYMYIRKIKDLAENRIDISNLNRKLLLDFSAKFPKWIVGGLNI